jgi:UDP-glucose 4-epimerase
MKKHYWVTGARGFIGRHLARRLAASGHRVAGLGHRAWPAAEAEAWGVSEWVNGEVSASNLAEMQAKFGTPAGIFHFAGGSSVSAGIANPHEDFKRTVVSTAEVLEWLRQHAPHTPVMAVSSSAVYGAAHAAPIAEDVRPVPYSPYGAHKLMMEELCRSYAVNFGLMVVLPRLFSVFGPELKKQLLWDLCCKLTVFGAAELGGSGREMRDWTNVNDVAVVLEKLIAFAANDAPVINVATGTPGGVRDVAAEVARAWSGREPPEISFNGISRVGDPDSLCADVAKLHSLGLACATPLAQGLADYVTWFRSVKDCA